MAPSTRRRFVRRGVLAAGGVAVLGPVAACREALELPPAGGLGELADDPGGLLVLPDGFRYRVLSEPGRSPRGKGLPTPGQPDGMAAFRGPGEGTVLVRNHELSPTDEGLDAVEGRRPFDRAAPGGTTALVLASDGRVVDQYVTSSGSVDNCAGGPTPWGTWLTCEESKTEGHGYVFEVRPGERDGALARRPIRAMGRFSHEAAAVDPGTGIVYLTEDDFSAGGASAEGAEAFLYRYLPDDRRPRPGALAKGGRLEVLALTEDAPVDGADALRPRRAVGIVWRPVGAEDPRGDAQDTADAVRFGRLEGAAFAGGVLWFDDTKGGARGLGQVFRLWPERNRLELFFEGRDAGRTENPDNLVVTPWGDLWFAEDGAGANRVRGLTPAGRLYDVLRTPRSELAGPTFAPDGRTFFVNLQESGLTVAVTGPFPRASAAARGALARARPPDELGPELSPALLEAAARNGLDSLEAAALERLGVRLA